MGSRLSNPKIQYSDDAGNPLPEGKLYFYDSGTTNFRATYADSGLNIANSNPVLLDGAGRVPSIFLEGNYRVILADKDDNQIWELDPITGASGSAQFSPWLIATTYVLNDIVKGSDSKYYISITNSNLGNNPTSSTANWSEMVFITMWNPNKTYNDEEIVIYSGLMYSSLQGSNLNKSPITEPTYWAQIGGAVAIANYLINANLNTSIINQRGFAGGQPAAGVYGYDRWKGDVLGTRIEQIVENKEVINEDFVISWVGGTGTADVNGVTGLNSGDTFTLNTSSNFSVIIPTDATYVQLEKGQFATPFGYRPIAEELALCQRYYEIGQGNYWIYAGAGDLPLFMHQYKVPKRTSAVTTSFINTGRNNFLGPTVDSGSDDVSVFFTDGTLSITGAANTLISWAVDADF